MAIDFFEDVSVLKLIVKTIKRIIIINIVSIILYANS